MHLPEKSCQVRMKRKQCSRVFGLSHSCCNWSRVIIQKKSQKKKKHPANAHMGVAIYYLIQRKECAHLCAFSIHHTKENNIIYFSQKSSFQMYRQGEWMTREATGRQCCHFASPVSKLFPFCCWPSTLQLWEAQRCVQPSSRAGTAACRK